MSPFPPLVAIQSDEDQTWAVALEDDPVFIVCEPYGFHTPEGEPDLEKDAALAHIFAAAPDLLSEAEKNLEILVDLRDKHLTGAAAVVRALVQKRIEATQVAIAKTRPA